MRLRSESHLTATPRHGPAFHWLPQINCTVQEASNWFATQTSEVYRRPVKFRFRRRPLMKQSKCQCSGIPPRSWRPVLNRCPGTALLWEGGFISGQRESAPHGASLPHSRRQLARRERVSKLKSKPKLYSDRRSVCLGVRPATNFSLLSVIMCRQLRLQ
jgi:hypothetical protein